MIHPIFTKIINAMPSSIMRPVSKILVKAYVKKYADIKLHNEDELINTKGPVLIVANHLSNSDGLILNKVLKGIDPFFVAGTKLNKKNSISRIGWEALKTVPIKPNTADIDAMRKCIEILKSGKSVFIFPEGTRSRTGGLLEGKKGVILMAKKAGVPILPIGLTGTGKLMPINDKDMGKEVFARSEINVNIGKKFFLPERDENENKDAFNERCITTIMKNIAALIPREYRGVYK
jgi:1-acyl-sn-glycerol-3-phosphate acyltransferase